MFATAKMFMERMEEFDNMTLEEKQIAMRENARQMAEEERCAAMGIPMERDIDLKEMGLHNM